MTFSGVWLHDLTPRKLLELILDKYLFVCVFGAICGCSTPNSDTTSAAQRVSKMAEQALSSCGRGNVKTVSTDSFSCKNTKKEPKDYIDVSSYLKGQLRYIDTIPFAFLKVVQKDSIYTDSQYITKEQVKEIANQFLVEELEKKNFENNFQETSFADATIHTITITYEATNKNSPVTRVDVYVNPEKEQISQLYLVRNQERGDSVVSQQLLWKHNKSFVLITSVIKKDGTEKNITERVIWDEREDD